MKVRVTQLCVRLVAVIFAAITAKVGVSDFPIGDYAEPIGYGLATILFFLGDLALHKLTQKCWKVKVQALESQVAKLQSKSNE